MTMAWTAQTGLGPRTVALSLKVFIVVMFYAHERLGICTAQPGDKLPEALHENLDELIERFCTKGCDLERKSGKANCERDQQSPKPLCSQICSLGSCNAQCWKHASMSTSNTGRASLCNGDQTEVCGYSNADICQDNKKKTDITRICVYTTMNSSPSFCMCQQSQPSRQYRCDPQVTTAQATTERYTTTQGITAGANAAQATASRVSTTNQPVNVVGIVFGSLFALLLLLVIIGTVLLCLLRQGRLPSFIKQASNPDGLSSVELEARDSTSTLPPQPPVPASSMEYSHAYDHTPAMPSAKADPNQEEPTYCSVGEDGHREGNPRYVLDLNTKKLDTATNNAKEHPYFVLNRNEGDDEVGSESEGGHGDDVEVTDSLIRVQAKEAIDEEYTPLVPTGDPVPRTEQYGNKVVVSPTPSPKLFSIELPTEGLSNGAASTYFPLILSAEPKSPVEQSGYEDAKIPTSESHDATSPTGTQSISCDDNPYTPLIISAEPKSTVEQSGYEDAKIPTSERHDATSPTRAISISCDDSPYTPLIRTAEPKSQKKCSGYEVPIIPKPRLADDGDVTAPYDHFDRKRENVPKKSAVSTADNDNYQQLVNKK